MDYRIRPSTRAVNVSPSPYAARQRSSKSSASGGNGWSGQNSRRIIRLRLVAMVAKRSECCTCIAASASPAPGCRVHRRRCINFNTGLYGCIPIVDRGGVPRGSSCCVYGTGQNLCQDLASFIGSTGMFSLAMFG
jgi:hypothetical protein